LLYIRHPSGPCGDTGHLGHYKNNWTELNWIRRGHSVGITASPGRGMTISEVESVGHSFWT